VGVNIPVRHVTWKPCWRVIPTRYPEERLLDRVTEPEDRDNMLAVDQMTNERERDESGEIVHVPASERAKGPGAAYIMAAFAYRNPEGSRFSDGSYGVYYAAKDQDTAIAESRYHREKFMKRTNEGPMWLEMRVLTATLSGSLHDIRGMVKPLHSVYSATSYGASQDLGVGLRRDGSSGIVYDSVRRKGGECVAAFRAPLLSGCHSPTHLIYEWNGEKISRVLDVLEHKKEKSKGG
jgi:hypothetical protein